MDGVRRRRQVARREVLMRLERELWSQGFEGVAGVDEVGVGSIAGPVVAAAVMLPSTVHILGIDDSKKLTRATRNRLADEIRACAVGIGLGTATVEEIDRFNVYRAALEAMRRAVAALPTPPDYVLVDARQIPAIAIPQLPLIKGDGQSLSIAAASIIAKVTRDAMMTELNVRYPVYGFGSHMGYATASHLHVIGLYGPCPAHRRSFAPISQLALPGMGGQRHV
jgi:ribonuclease HII